MVFLDLNILLILNALSIFFLQTVSFHLLKYEIDISGFDRIGLNIAFLHQPE